MKTRATTLLVAVALCLVPVASHAQLLPYVQNFESMNMADPNALLAEGWNAYVNDFDGSHNYLWGYGFQAPNGGNAASAIVTGQGGAGQGAQQLSIYSNYNDNNAATGFVETNVYKEMTIDGASVGKTVLFRFDAKHGDWTGAAHNPTAAAFFKVLNPAQGWATTHFITLDMSAIPPTWGTYQLTLPIDATLPGQILQFGFMNVQTGYDPTAVFYDNITFAPDAAVPAGATTWGHVKGLYH